MYSHCSNLSTKLAFLSRLLIPALLLFSAAAGAAHHKTGHGALWSLDDAASTVSFVSVKAGDVAEAHKFGSLAGGVLVKPDAAPSHSGDVDIKIDLTSVNTNIAIRDERMREHLFETAKFPAASVHGHIPVMDFLALAVGSSVQSSLKLMLDLHGAKVPFSAEVLVSRLSRSRIVVTSMKPVVLNASGFGLVAGIEKLRELAGLPAISSAVPVTFVLTLNSATEAN